MAVFGAVFGLLLVRSHPALCEPIVSLKAHGLRTLIVCFARIYARLLALGVAVSVRPRGELSIDYYKRCVLPGRAGLGMQPQGL